MSSKWTIDQLREHFQYAIQLEYWTIPFYMSAMYSIKDSTHSAYRLIQSVVYQEMFHVQLAGNCANAYGTPIDLEHAFIPPVYEGKNIPHLDPKAVNDPNHECSGFCPYSAEIGPLDLERINAMCLIEYPKYEMPKKPDLKGDVTTYSSIGAFYQALLFGASQHVDAIEGDRSQVDIFRNFYRNMAVQTVEHSGGPGFAAVKGLIHAITDQGEGEKRYDSIPLEYRNTADGFDDTEDHFDKFVSIKTLDPAAWPETYQGEVKPRGDAGKRAQETLLGNFNRFRSTMVELFNGKPVDNTFGPQMATLGGNILNCWKNGAIPQFS